MSIFFIGRGLTPAGGSHAQENETCDHEVVITLGECCGINHRRVMVKRLCRTDLAVCDSVLQGVESDLGSGGLSPSAVRPVRMCGMGCGWTGDAVTRALIASCVRFCSPGLRKSTKTDVSGSSKSRIFFAIVSMLSANSASFAHPVRKTRCVSCFRAYFRTTDQERRPADRIFRSPRCGSSRNDVRCGLTD